MKAYSLDLRQRVVDAIDNHFGTYREVAETFGVHESFIYKLLRRRRETGDITPAPHGGGVEVKLDDQALEKLGELVYASPDATLEDLRTQLQKKIKVKVSVTTLWRGLDKLDLPLKKRRAKPRRPTQKSEPNFKKNRAA